MKERHQLEQDGDQTKGPTKGLMSMKFIAGCRARAKKPLLYDDHQRRGCR